ncbi:unnamed protein product, partial [Prorocentrum cordatum]
VASSRLEGQLESQQKSFGLVVEAIHLMGLESCSSSNRASQRSSLRPSWGVTRLSACHGGADIMSHISPSFDPGRHEKRRSTISTSAWNAPQRLAESVVRLSGCSRRSGPRTHVESAHESSDCVQDLPADDLSLDEPPDKNWGTIPDEGAKEQPNKDVECIDASNECIDASDVDVGRTSSLRCKPSIVGLLAGNISGAAADRRTARVRRRGRSARTPRGPRTPSPRRACPCAARRA